MLQFIGSGTAISLSGCNFINSGREERQPTLRVLPNIEQTEDAWKMNIWLRHTSDTVTSAHDVTVIAFTTHGGEICQIKMGDFPIGGRFEERESTICNKFPAIVTATAEESPCDGAHIRMVYYTSEKDPADVDDLSHHRFWEGRKRECGEDLPPGHVLEKVQQSGAATTTRSD